MPPRDGGEGSIFSFFCLFFRHAAKILRRSLFSLTWRRAYDADRALLLTPRDMLFCFTPASSFERLWRRFTGFRYAKILSRRRHASAAAEATPLISHASAFPSRHIIHFALAPRRWRCHTQQRCCWRSEPLWMVRLDDAEAKVCYGIHCAPAAAHTWRSR